MIITLSGLPCAGKTTGGQILKQAYGFEHIEASDEMNRAYKLADDKECSINEFAASLLLRDPTYVARKVIRNVESINRSVVISGFRSISELKYLTSATDRYRVVPCFVKASREVRWDRSVKRARKSSPKNHEEFLEQDRIQSDMGLSSFMCFNEVTPIENDGCIETYEAKLLDLVVRHSD